MSLRTEKTPTPLYDVVANVHDPLTDQGMAEDPADIRKGQPLLKAVTFALTWMAQGYYTSVYSCATGECVTEYVPKGGRR